MSDRKFKVNNALSLKAKLDVIDNGDNLTVKQLCEKYKCGKTQIYSILKNKNKIRNYLFTGGRNLNSKRQSKSLNEDINKILYKWFINARSNSHPVTGPILQEQAKLIASELGNTTFKASNGWLDSFRARHSISFKKVSKESNDCLQNDVDWCAMLDNAIKDYASHNIASCSEFGLFYSALPGDTLNLKNEKCHKGEKSKQRFTILVCGFADGTIEKPLIISKSLPRFNVDPILADWRTNRKAWMTGHLMENWLFNFNERLKADNRNILLFLKQATCHPELQFSNITIVFTPKNQATPMEQGVINTIKIHYRTKLVQYTIVNKKSNYKLRKQITVLDAFRWLTSSFEEVTDLCVLSSFKKAGFPTTTNNNDCHSVVCEMKHLNRLLHSIGDETITAKNYVDIDQDLSVEGEIHTLGELIKEETTVAGSDDEDSETICNDDIKIKSFAEALNIVNELEEFAILIKNPRIQYQLFQLKSAIESEGALNS